MALTQQETARLSAKWRGLAQLALDVASPGSAPQPIERLKSEAYDALNWPSPLPGYQDAFVLFALSRLGAAVAKCSYEAAVKRRDALRSLALVVLDMLGSPPAPLTLPFRADIDG